MEIEKNKLVIGLYGELRLSMKLHNLNWSVHKSYIDEGIDFFISQYYCKNCKKFTQQFIRNEKYKGRNSKCVTNLCHLCKKSNIKIIFRAIQVKTSEGVPTKKESVRSFSFHPKIRYDIDGRLFYIWIAVINENNLHYYIFNSKDVTKFDDTSIDTYQITDNQKTSLQIDTEGEVLNKGKKYDYNCFNTEFHNNFAILNKITSCDI